jgi:hypothetical protein
MPLPARLIWKFSIDIAERNGALLRRRLRSAERLRDCATARGVRLAKTPLSRSSASLVRMTCADQRFFVAAMPTSAANDVPEKGSGPFSQKRCQDPARVDRFATRALSGNAEAAENRAGRVHLSRA